MTLAWRKGLRNNWITRALRGARQLNEINLNELHSYVWRMADNLKSSSRFTVVKLISNRFKLKGFNLRDEQKTLQPFPRFFSFVWKGPIRSRIYWRLDYANGTTASSGMSREKINWMSEKFKLMFVCCYRRCIQAVTLSSIPDATLPWEWLPAKAPLMLLQMWLRLDYGRHDDDNLMGFFFHIVAVGRAACLVDRLPTVQWGEATTLSSGVLRRQNNVAHSLNHNNRCNCCDRFFFAFLLFSLLFFRSVVRHSSFIGPTSVTENRIIIMIICRNKWRNQMTMTTGTETIDWTMEQFGHFSVMTFQDKWFSSQNKW